MDVAKPKPSLSIVVPTYREAENLPELVKRIERVGQEHGLTVEVLIMDDDSRDGTEEAVAALGRPWVRLVVRTANRGLSPAVLDGFALAQHDVFAVMDADLSHPPEKLPELVEALEEGADFALGSRYIEGGSTDEDWGLLRAINSRVATLLARPLTSVRDPMSGFFAFRREVYENAAPLNPVGYKIGLEMLVKGGCTRAREVPIHFSQRRHGTSKLSLAEQLRYLQHLRRLFVFRYGNWAHFFQFAAVGFSGTIVNLAILTVLVWVGVRAEIAMIPAIFVSMLSNFALNRRFTFSYARTGNLWRQLVGFIGASSIGMGVNYVTAVTVLHAWSALERVPQVASMAGILAGLIFNYMASRYFVFVKPRREEVRGRDEGQLHE
ncbi:MAG TPA: glycosyltransferase family 2 protein [Candidatus Hydrogenedentes bacterium]|nr:glycosyltransferase family 2 protein [Candidatus Hydrogenedentota bacterium]